MVTAWLITGRSINSEFHVDATINIHFGNRADKSWAIQLHDAAYWHVTGGITTVGTGDSACNRGDVRYKLAMNLVKDTGDRRRSSTHTTLVLCSRVPERVKFAIAKPGAFTLNRRCGLLDPSAMQICCQSSSGVSWGRDGYLPGQHGNSQARDGTWGFPPDHPYERDYQQLS